MTTNQINEVYVGWLYSQINWEYKHHCLNSYNMLTHMLWVKPFAWTVPNDDNRIEDGKELRYLFITDPKLRITFPEHLVEDFRAQPCSTLEVIVALSRRLAFAAQGEPGWWAWKLLSNLHLDKMKDPVSRRKQIQVDDILETLIWRTYNWDGEGGFFPIAHPRDDMKKVEIWYQMSAYLEEFGHP